MLAHVIVVHRPYTFRSTPIRYLTNRNGNQRNCRGSLSDADQARSWPYVETIHCAIITANAPPDIEPEHIYGVCQNSVLSLETSAYNAACGP